TGAEASGLADVPTPRTEVLVTVPVFSLLGLTEEPAMLDGYGPVPASMARDLVANGADSFHRVLVDPRDGAPLEISRTSYRLTKAMRNWLRMRDGKCSFPGCSNQSLDNEADHLLAWHHGGTTGISNLGQLCARHHRLKHAVGWRSTPATKNEPPGWVSPSGRKYRGEHQDWEPPRWPPSLGPRAGEGHRPGPYTPTPTASGGPADYLHISRSAGEDCLHAYLSAR
ncbi:HNH endonuclease signature motif containing protein, partial [Arthrobacter sp. HMWF013]|uniref:HNH endonuclease signature motif containing protein n=1 Tax=Arthrobacter sp. HMWF013 TaxID=2056849 RepID=UPI000D429470